MSSGSVFFFFESWLFILFFKKIEFMSQAELDKIFSVDQRGQIFFLKSGKIFKNIVIRRV